MRTDSIPCLKSLCKGRYCISLLNVVSACLAKHEASRPSAINLLTIFSRTISAFVTKNKVPLPPSQALPSRPPSPVKAPLTPTPTFTPVQQAAPLQQQQQQQQATHRQVLVAAFVATMKREEEERQECQDTLTEHRALYDNDDELLMIVTLMCVSRQGQPRQERDSHACSAHVGLHRWPAV